MMQHVLDHLRETRTQLFALVQGLDEDGEPASPGARRRDPSPSPSPSRCGSEASDCSSTSESSDDDEQSVAASEPPAEIESAPDYTLVHEEDAPSPQPPPPPPVASSSAASPVTGSGGRRRGQRRGRRSGRWSGAPRAVERLDQARPEVVCLPCEPQDDADGDGDDGLTCRTDDAKADVRFQLCVERQQERVEAYANDAELGEAIRTARYHCYRAFCAREFAGEPQGSGQRCKLPDCFEKYVRGLFPNPECRPGPGGCDLLRGCERAGHYTGFLTVAESKERRIQLKEQGWEPLWKDEFY